MHDVLFQFDSTRECNVVDSEKKKLDLTYQKYINVADIFAFR